MHIDATLIFRISLKVVFLQMSKIIKVPKLFVLEKCGQALVKISFIAPPLINVTLNVRKKLENCVRKPFYFKMGRIHNVGKVCSQSFLLFHS
jgi:hypothetical protein